MLSRAQNRLYKEMGNMKVTHPEFEVTLNNTDDIMHWFVSFHGGEGTLYGGETYTL
jgi:ubiquitin-protein ligase